MCHGHYCQDGLWLVKSDHVTPILASDWSGWVRTGPYAEARHSAQHVLIDPLHEFRHFQRHWIFSWSKIQVKICLKIGSVKLVLFTINLTMDRYWNDLLSMIYQSKESSNEWIMISFNRTNQGRGTMEKIKKHCSNFPNNFHDLLRCLLLVIQRSTVETIGVV